MRLLYPPVKAKVFDLFCGTGGFSKGFEKSRAGGYEIVFGIDLLPMSIETFHLNHASAFALAGDIRKVHCMDVMEKLRLKRGEPGLNYWWPPMPGVYFHSPFSVERGGRPAQHLV